jgi:hypothetical protein
MRSHKSLLYLTSQLLNNSVFSSPRAFLGSGLSGLKHDGLIAFFFLRRRTSPPAKLRVVVFLSFFRHLKNKMMMGLDELWNQALDSYFVTICRSSEDKDALVKIHNADGGINIRNSSRRCQRLCDHWS